MTDIQRMATSRIREWRHNARQFVRDVFHATPDAWQDDVLEELSNRGRVRIGMKACAGPGKTCVLAWEGWRRLLCFASKNEHPKGMAVSITSENLNGGLWPEMARWQNESEMLLKAFQWTKTRIFAKDHPETWFLQARGWAKTADPETIGRTLSGVHARYPFYLIDESGDIPPNMLRSAEQGMTSCEDGLIMTAGNTTSMNGLLYEACVRNAGKFKVFSITGDPDDPKRAPRVDLAWAKENIELYGRDNPWVMAFVLGQFPPGSINTLLTIDEVEAAMKLNPRIEQYGWAQKRLGTDVARYGDDRTVIFPRQGIASFKPIIMRHPVDSAVSVDIGNRVMARRNEWMEEARKSNLHEFGYEIPDDVLTFFDDTVGWAHGAVDFLRASGLSPYAIRFDNKQTTDPRYFNLRAEMWMGMAKWIKAGGALPTIPEMTAELTAPTYGFKEGKMIIEPKDLVKKRLGRSPDLADALALTFAIPDAPAGVRMPGGIPGRSSSTGRQAGEYDPYARI